MRLYKLERYPRTDTGKGYQSRDRSRDLRRYPFSFNPANNMTKGSFIR